jgi:hypothetical protein
LFFMIRFRRYFCFDKIQHLCELILAEPLQKVFLL